MLRLQDLDKQFQAEQQQSLAQQMSINKQNSIKIHTYGVTKQIKLTFLYNKDDMQRMKTEKSLGEAVVLTDTPEEELKLKTIEDEITSYFVLYFEAIQVYGYSLFHFPLANQVITLLNISNVFQKNQRTEEMIETDLLLGYSFIASRRYQQAAEIFKRSSNFFLKKYELQKPSEFQSVLFIGGETQKNQQPLQLNQLPFNLGGGAVNLQDKNSTQKQFHFFNQPSSIQSPQFKMFSQSPRDPFGHSALFGSSGFPTMGTTNKLLLRAAKIELLVADAIRSPQLVQEKIQAYQLATEYFLGYRIIQNLEANCDTYTTLLFLCPYLCKFLLKTLDEKIDPLRIAAIRGLEFMIEYLGCTISQHLPQILKQVVLTYPSGQQQQNSLNQQFDNYQETITSSENEKGYQSQSNDHNLNNNYSEITYNNSNDDDFGGMGGINKDSKYSSSLNYQQYEQQQQQGGGGKHMNMNQQQNIQQKIIYDMYHRLLESFLNLLASASSQILRSIFNDVISTQLFILDIPLEMRLYLYNITQKIISICQGDIQIQPSFLVNMMNLLQNQQISQNVKKSTLSMWEAIKQKLIINLEIPVLNKIIEMLVENIYQIAELENQQQQQQNNIEVVLDLLNIIIQREKRVLQSLPPNFAKYSKKLELSEEILNIKSFVKPLIVWIDVILQNPKKLDIFKKTWNLLVEVVSVQQKPQEYSLSDIAISLLQRVMKFIENSSPTQPMLNFLLSIFEKLDVTFQQIFPLLFKNLNKKQFQDQQLLKFINQFLGAFITCVPHSIYDETFQILDILINSQEELSEQYIQQIILALNNQYTMKGHQQKKSVLNFINYLMKCDNVQENNSEGCNNINVKSNFYLNTIFQMCLINNVEILTVQPESQSSIFQKQKKLQKKLDKKNQQKQNDLFIEKLIFLLQCLDFLKEQHFIFLLQKMQDQTLQEGILKFLNSGNSKIRLKGFSIIKKIYEKFSTINEKVIRQIEISMYNKESTFASSHHMDMKEDEEESLFSFSKIIMTKFLVCTLKCALENFKDPKQQFNALLMLDQLFQNIFGGPNLESELEFYSTYKQQKNFQQRKKIQIIDLDDHEFSIEKQYKYSDEIYLHMRLLQILKFWPLLQNLINSSWSNIRSLTYGVICNWVRPDLNHYKSSYQKKLTTQLFGMLMSLLTSKESECRTGGLNILGSLCGLSYNYDVKLKDLKKYLGFFKRHENLISLAIWEAVYEIQADWDITNQAAAMTIIQISAPRDSIRHFFRLKKEGMTLKANQIQQQQHQQQQIQNSQFTSKDFNKTPNQHNQQLNMLLMSGDDSLLASDMVLRSGKQNINMDLTPIRKYSSHQMNQTDDQFNQKLQQNISNDSYSFENNQNSDESGYSDKNPEKEENEQDLQINQFFWVDNISQEEIRDMISMFRNEYKPPLTLWIERNHYNTENKEDDNQTGAYQTLNEEDDMFGFYEEFNQQAEFQNPQQKKEFQDRPKSSHKHNLNDIDGISKIKNNNNINDNNNNYLNQNDDDIDFEKLGIVEIEEDEMQDYYYDLQLQNQRQSFGNKDKHVSLQQQQQMQQQHKQELIQKQQQILVQEEKQSQHNNNLQQQQFAIDQHGQQTLNKMKQGINLDYKEDNLQKQDEINQYYSFEQAQNNKKNNKFIQQQLQDQENLSDDDDSRPPGRVGFYQQKNKNKQGGAQEQIQNSQDFQNQKQKNFPNQQLSQNQQRNVNNQQDPYNQEVYLNENDILVYEDIDEIYFHNKDKENDRVQQEIQQELLFQMQKQQKQQEDPSRQRKREKEREYQRQLEKNQQHQKLDIKQNQEDSNQIDFNQTQKLQLSQLSNNNKQNQQIFEQIDLEDQKKEKKNQKPQLQPPSSDKAVQQSTPQTQNGQLQQQQSQVPAVQKEQKRRDTFDNNDYVTLSFSDSSQFKDEEQKTKENKSKSTIEKESPHKFNQQGNSTGKNANLLESQKQQLQQQLKQQQLIQQHQQHEDEIFDKQQLYQFMQLQQQQIFQQQQQPQAKPSGNQKQQKNQVNSNIYIQNELDQKTQKQQINDQLKQIKNQQDKQIKFKDETVPVNTPRKNKKNSRYKSYDNPSQLLTNLQDLNNFEMAEGKQSSSAKKKKIQQLSQDKNTPSPFKKSKYFFGQLAHESASTKNKKKSNSKSPQQKQLGNSISPQNSPSKTQTQINIQQQKLNQYENKENKNKQPTSSNTKKIKKPPLQQKKKNLDLYNFDKLYKTDLLSKFLDTTKSSQVSQPSTKKASYVTPKSSKTKHSTIESVKINNNQSNSLNQSQRVQNNPQDKLVKKYLNLHKYDQFSLSENNDNISSKNQTINLSDTQQMNPQQLQQYYIAQQQHLNKMEQIIELENDEQIQDELNSNNQYPENQIKSYEHSKKSSISQPVDDLLESLKGRSKSKGKKTRQSKSNSKQRSRSNKSNPGNQRTTVLSFTKNIPSFQKKKIDLSVYLREQSPPQRASKSVSPNKNTMQYAIQNQYNQTHNLEKQYKQLLGKGTPSYFENFKQLRDTFTQKVRKNNFFKKDRQSGSGEKGKQNLNNVTL